eukprot:3941064-Rhodomonas_salina.2
MGCPLGRQRFSKLPKTVHCVQQRLSAGRDQGDEEANRGPIERAMLYRGWKGSYHDNGVVVFGRRGGGAEATGQSRLGCALRGF